MKTETPKTLTELATLLGVSRQLIAAHRKKPGAPPLTDLKGWQVLLAEAGREGSAPAHLREKIAGERLRLLAAMAAREEGRLARERGEVVSRSEIQTALLTLLPRFFDEIENQLLNELPPALAGLTPDRIAAICRQKIDRLTTKLRADLLKLGEEQKPT